MSLARAWRRQLYGASSAGLIVPTAMLAALVVLAPGDGLGQVGVLGQIFAGPAAPGESGGAGSAGGAGHVGPTAHPLPVIPAAALGVGRSRSGTGRAAPVRRRERPGLVPVSSRGPRKTGGALSPVGGVAPIVDVQAPVPSQPAPTGSQSSPVSSPQPSPSPTPRPTPVDQIVKTITPVTQLLPAPVGPVAKQAVQVAGSAADTLIPPGMGSAPAPPSGLELP